MAKKKQHTFADEAMALQKRFPRRETDPIEKEDYKRSMMRLMQEQEMARQEMGLDNQPKQQFPYGGNLPSDFAIKSAIDLGPYLRGQNLQMPLADLTGVQPGVTEVNVTGDKNAAINRKYSQNGYTPGMKEFPGPATKQFNKAVQTPDFKTLPWSAGNSGESQYLTPAQLAQMGQPWERPAQTGPTEQSGSVGNSGTQVPTSRTPIQMNPMQSLGTPQIGQNMVDPGGLTVQDPGKGVSNLKGSWWDNNKDMAPYAISGLSNIASNLILANQAGKNIPKMTPNIGEAERINLEPQANAMRQQANVAKNVATRNARNLGVNNMEALAGMGAASSSIDRNLGQNLTGLYMGQEQANVGAANQYGLQNMRSNDRANMFNAQSQMRAKENQAGYLGAAMSTLPGVMKDIRMDRADKEMRDVMSAYYNSMGRNYMVEGDIFKNPQDGFKYKVRNNELIKVGKI